MAYHQSTIVAKIKSRNDTCMMLMADSARRKQRRHEVCIEALAWTPMLRIYGTIGDLSTTGCRFIGGEALPEGSELHMSFELPGSSDTIRCDARSVWRDGKDGALGFEFVRMSEASRQQLTLWLNNHVRW